jgi:hypothetical protein
MLLRTPEANELPDGTLEQPPAQVDLLDLRMWRWRQGAALQRDCLHGIGLVEYMTGSCLHWAAALRLGTQKV